ncbi:MAG: hypothetical protein WBB45_12105 [Cyclobacteriaceae bacterium]
MNNWNKIQMMKNEQIASRKGFGPIRYGNLRSEMTLEKDKPGNGGAQKKPDE